MTNSPRFLKLSLLLMLAACASCAAFAADVFRPPTPEELKMTSEPMAPGAPAVNLYRQVSRNDNGDYSTETNYLRIKILTEEGRKYADVEIPIAKSDGVDATDIKARTIRPDGTITNFQGQIFEKEIVKAKGLRYTAKTFTLPDVQPGSIVEYTYKMQYRRGIYDSRWILNDELFTKTADFSLKPAADYACQWVWHKLPAGTAEPKLGSDGTIRLQVNNIAAAKTEDFMPPTNEVKGRVDFIYTYGSPEKDPEKFWKNTAKTLNGFENDFINKRHAMEDAVSQIVSPSDAPEVKLQKIYARVQQLRNTSYEVEKTQQEQKRAKEKEHNSVEDVWKRGYGNGFQLTQLFLGLARAAGFDAYEVWVSSRASYFFNPASKDASKLNSNVVLVKLNGKDLYFDPGAAYTPFGVLPWSETGVAGLRLDKNGGGWITTPIPLSSESRVERHADLKLTDTGSLEGTLKIIFTGLEAVRLRVEQRQSDDAARKRELEQIAKDEIPAASDVELTNKPDWNSSASTLEAEFKVTVPGWMERTGRRGMMPIGIFSGQEKHVFDHADRTYPIYFEFPFERQDEVSIHLPEGWEVGGVPKPQDQKGGDSFEYVSNATNDHGTLRLNRKLKVDALLIDTKFYAALRNFFQTVRAGDEDQVMLQPAANRAGK